MDSQKYMAKMHETLKRDYCTPDGKYSESCSLIAFVLTELLIKEGRSPELFVIREGVKDDYFIHNKTLLPVQYNGRIKWNAHVICCADGLAYDPIMEKPIPLKDYCKTVFGEEVKMERRAIIRLEDYFNVLAEMGFSE